MGQMIEFTGERGHVPGYLAQPEGDGHYPGVVVIQEWWGLNDHIKDVTDRFAKAGYIALAPDLYRGQVAHEPDDARRLAMELEREQALIDIQGAVDYLNGLPNVQPKKIGVIGFCLGGGLAGMMSYKGRNLGAVAVFYGGRFAVDDALAPQIHTPILGIYGEADQGIPLEMVKTTEAALERHAKPHEFVIYPNAPHAFFNDSRAHTYVADAAADAWERTLRWFGRYLTQGDKA